MEILIAGRHQFQAHLVSHIDFGPHEESPVRVRLVCGHVETVIGDDAKFARAHWRHPSAVPTAPEPDVIGDVIDVPTTLDLEPELQPATATAVP